MFLKRYISVAMLFCCSVAGLAQNRNSNWCFGDSAGLDFGTGAPTLFTSSVKSRGSCASVSDSLGQLLFYAYTRATLPGNTTLVKNRDYLLMQNGGNIIGRGWYEELVIIPNPSDSNQYYLFSIGVTSIFGLYYSVIDMNLDNGKGAVTNKNVQLQNYQASDCVKAIKHGNGRDWWILFRHTDMSNNDFYEYLVSPSGISGPIIHSVGTTTINNNYRLLFSSTGEKMIGYDVRGLIELFDFDRCTGQITFNQNIAQEGVGANIPYYFGGAISPNDRYLYLTTIGVDTSAYLIQFDLQSPDIFNSADTIWSLDLPDDAGGFLKLAPDGKIYLACAWNDGIHGNYPYPDTAFNQVNNNLSVINYPDSPGVACGFTPFSFNLGAGRCYWGLPNNPDYELGAVVNSMCDTVLSVDSRPLTVDRNSQLHVFYHPGWQIAFINAEGLKGKKYNLQVYDLFGRIIFSDEGSLNSEYYTKDLNCDGFAKGMYVVTVSTEKENLSKKFIKQ